MESGDEIIPREQSNHALSLSPSLVFWCSGQTLTSSHSLSHTHILSSSFSLLPLILSHCFFSRSPTLPFSLLSLIFSLTGSSLFLSLFFFPFVSYVYLSLFPPLPLFIYLPFRSFPTNLTSLSLNSILLLVFLSCQKCLSKVFKKKNEVIALFFF